MKIITTCLTFCLLSSGYCADFEENNREKNPLLKRSFHKEKSSIKPFKFPKDRQVVNDIIKYKNWPEVKIANETGFKVQLVPIDEEVDPDFLFSSVYKVKFNGKFLKNSEGGDFRLNSSVELTFTPLEGKIKISEIDVLLKEYRSIANGKTWIYFVTSDYKVTSRISSL